MYLMSLVNPLRETQTAITVFDIKKIYLKIIQQIEKKDALEFSLKLVIENLTKHLTKKKYVLYQTNYFIQKFQCRGYSHKI